MNAKEQLGAIVAQYGLLVTLSRLAEVCKDQAANLVNPGWAAQAPAVGNWQRAARAIDAVCQLNEIRSV